MNINNLIFLILAVGKIHDNEEAWFLILKLYYTAWYASIFQYELVKMKVNVQESYYNATLKAQRKKEIISEGGKICILIY